MKRILFSLLSIAAVCFQSAPSMAQAVEGDIHRINPFTRYIADIERKYRGFGQTEFANRVTNDQELRANLLTMGVLACSFSRDGLTFEDVYREGETTEGYFLRLITWQSAHVYLCPYYETDFLQ